MNGAERLFVWACMSLGAGLLLILPGLVLLYLAMRASR